MCAPIAQWIERIRPKDTMEVRFLLGVQFIMVGKIPVEVLEVLEKIKNAGFEAFVVGGCVRDLVMDKIPNDWDVTTNALPEEIVGIFPDSFYENNFGTVGVKVRPFLKNKFLRKEREHDIIEVTTYRIESKYSDFRRPDDVSFAKTLGEDLGRRDFTMNAMALRVHSSGGFEIIDHFNGKKDIAGGVVRSVGNPDERFMEDALRMMRAVRFCSQLGFTIEKNTLLGIKNSARLTAHISAERIRDELIKIILSSDPAGGIDILHQTGLLQYIIPELERGIGIAQNRHHIYTIYNHLLYSLKNCPSGKLEVRLAALFHDIAKPQTKRGEGLYATFYNHDHIGARIVEKILRRLKFSNEIIEKVVLLVDNHMFYYNPEEVTESSVRRLIRKVGLENIKDLIDLRVADRLGSGTPKAKPYKLRHLEYIVERVSKDAVSVKMLEINGKDLISELNISPGPMIGAILDVLLAEVIDDAAKNNRNYLLERAKELAMEDLERLRFLARDIIKEKKQEDDEEIKRKHWVK